MIVVGQGTVQPDPALTHDDRAVSPKPRDDGPVQRRSVGPADVGRAGGARLRDQVEIDGYWTVAQRGPNRVGTVSIAQRIVPEAQIDAAWRRMHGAVGASLDVAVPAPLGADQQAHSCHPVVGARAGVGTQAEVDEQVEIVAEDTEVEPLLVPMPGALERQRPAQAIRREDGAVRASRAGR